VGTRGRRVALVLGALALAFSPGARGAALLVHPDGGGDYPTIQGAIAAAAPGDTIRLAPGIYRGAGNRDLDPMGKAIRIEPLDAGQDCIIDCQGSPGEPHTGIYAHSGESPATEIAGLTITGGHLTVGGAIYCGNGARPTFEQIICWANTAGNGGAVMCNGTSPRFVRATFHANASSGVGAAFHCVAGASPEITGSIFTQNAGAELITCEGGAQPALTCCDVYGNVGGNWTGCIADQAGAEGNFSADPLYCNPGAGEFTLHLFSPCAEENNPSCGQIGARPVACGPTIYVVTPDGTGDFPTIQDAVLAALPGDTISLAGGVFRGEGNRDIDLLGKPICIKARGAEPVAIDCEGSEDDPHTGFYIHSGESSAAQIRHLMVTGGYLAAGGGIYCGNGSHPTITGIALWNNRAHTGGGIFCSGSSPALVNVTMHANRASVHGAAVACADGASPTLSHCLLSGSPQGEAVFCQDAGSQPLLACCDLHGNAGGDWVGCVADQLGADGNISADPLLCDPAIGDLSLHCTSPCAEANNPDCGRIGARAVGCWPTAHRILPDGSGDFPTIQAAIDGAFVGDTLLLASGTYRGEGNRDIDTRGRGLIIHSEDGPGECIIDCEGSERDPHSGFYLHSGEDAGTRIEGLTITGGWAVAGGGFYCGNGAAPSLREVILLGNHAAQGGGIFCNGASPLLSRVTFHECASSLHGAGIVATGGAHPVLASCVIAFSTDGAAVHCGDGLSSVALTCCDVYGNQGGDWVDCIANQSDVDRNFSADPLYCPGDLTVWNDSPCLQGYCGVVGARGLGCTDLQAAPSPTALAPTGLTAQPNPFSDRTAFSSPATTLEIIDLRGRRVRSLSIEDGPLAWDGRGADGRRAPAGMYFARGSTPAGGASCRILLLR